MADRSSTNKAKWFRWLRLGLGIAALVYVLWRVDRQEAMRVLAHADPLLLGSACALTALAMVGATAYRWQRLVSAQAADVPLPHLALYYLVGYFFNMFLPGSVGGDVYRVVKLGDEMGSQSGALATVVTERLLGLMALLPVGLVGFALSPTRLAGQREFIAVLTVLGLFLLSAPLWLRPSVVRPFRPLYERLLTLPLSQRLRIRERIERLYRAVSTYLDRPQTLLVPLALSLLSRLIWVAAAYLTGQAIGVGLPFYVYMAVLAITELLRMLPISLGGIGVREGAFVVLLAPFGVRSGSAFMLSFLFYLMLMGLGVVGGGIYLALGLRSSHPRTGAADPASRRTGPALWVVIGVTLVALLLFDRPLAVGDGLAYLIWLDSIALDGDLDLSNQAQKFGAVNTYHIYYNQRTGRWASAFPLGVALLLTPFYRVGAWLDTWPAFRVNDAHFLGIQGVPYAYTLCSMIGVNVYALLTVSLGYTIARRFARPWVAAGATIAAYLGTPLLFYTTVDPMNSHIAGGFSATLFITLWLRAREGPAAPTWRAALKWLWVGLAVGLIAVCRWQVALIALPAGIELLLRRRWREVVVLGLGFGLLAWIIPYTWWQMYGKLALIPATQGDESAVLIAPVNTLRVLFSPISGLFPWSPVTALALVGLWPLARRDWPLALSAGVMFVSQALVNGSVKNWWAGIGFGMRRMAELYPVYVLLLAALICAASQRRWLAALVGTLTAACVAYGVALVIARLNFTWTNPWGLARDTPLKELSYSFSRERSYLIGPVIKDHVGPWAWKKPGP